jgi:hypothetical protein
MDPTLHAKCCGSFWKPRRSHRRVDFYELSHWLDPQGSLSPALFWEARFWRIAELLPTEEKLHLRPLLERFNNGFNLGASGRAHWKRTKSTRSSPNACGFGERMEGRELRVSTKCSILSRLARFRAEFSFCDRRRSLTPAFSFLAFYPLATASVPVSSPAPASAGIRARRASSGSRKYRG